MSAFWRLSFSLAYIAVSTSNDGECHGRPSKTNFCCVDFYKDSATDQCLPCLGSYGVNCNFSCPTGYYGHGCRQMCNCSSDEECDAKRGCIPRNNQSTAVYGQQKDSCINYDQNCSMACTDGSGCHKACDCNVTENCDLNSNCNEDDMHLNNSNLETKYVFLAVACICALIFGIAFYYNKRKRRKQCDHKGVTSIKVRDPRIIRHPAVTASEISSPVQMPMDDISSTPYEDQFRSKGQSNWSSLNEQSTLEQRAYGNNVYVHNQGAYDRRNTHVSDNVVVNSPRSILTTATPSEEDRHISMTYSANQTINFMEEDHQSCQTMNFENVGLSESAYNRPYSTVKYA